MIELKEQTYKILSYCDIPENIRETCSSLEETSNDVMVEYTITSEEDQQKYTDDFTLDNWILKEHPDLAGQKILIHIDY